MLFIVQLLEGVRFLFLKKHHHMEYEKHTHKNLFEIKVNMTEQSSDFKGLLVKKKKKPARRLVYFDRTG